MKKTLIVIHVMPSELDMFTRFMKQYQKSLMYLDENDDVTLYATLNLNPFLTDWGKSQVKQEFFINKWDKLFTPEMKVINEVNLFGDLLGTTQQKRLAIEKYKNEYDQFIFVDADIAVPEQLLKNQLNASYLIKDEFYVISPSIVKLWDNTWDVLVDSKFINEPVNYYKKHNPQLTYNQFFETTCMISLSEVETLKFGCGMHTLYSSTFWDLIGIPESFGAYGPEDTFAMFAGEFAKREGGYPIKQYVLKGLYISEDYINREPSFIIEQTNKKDEFRFLAERNFNIELDIFKKRLKTFKI